MRTLLILLTFLGFSYQPLKGEENFILIDGNTNEVIREFGSSIYERVTPACSFNIALSLMGYDTGVLKDEKTPTWDFQEGYEDFSESWKAPQTPESWMTKSCAWFSKIIALHLGLKKIQHYLALLEYGNQDMSAGLAKPGPTDPAWVSSSLKISPKEQVDFIQKMNHGNLPISGYALQMTKALLLKEVLSEKWKLYGKAGLGTIVKEDGENLKVRWFVGWVENDHHFFPFAYQMREKEIDIVQTVPRVKQLLEESNIMNLYEEKMQRESIIMPEIKLVGISVRTSNEQELDKMKGNIFPCVKQYFHGGLAEKIPNRKKPGTTFCAYTDYETDYTGKYTYFIGEEVSSFDTSLPEGFQKLVIPKQQYVKFTTKPAPMPDVIVNAWNEIWKMSAKQLGGQRGYKTDFEIYDERASDHQNIVLDLYIGIQP